MRRSLFKGKKGFTLIEAVMVIVLLGIVATGILMYFAGLSKTDQASIAVATGLAQERMERVIADAKANGFDTVVPAAPAALPAPFSKYTREVEAYCVQEADLDAPSGTMPACADSDIKAKRVRVTVTWPDGLVDLVTVITDH